ncbi:MAG: MBL fold metallo-hydrolase [Alphaproteobacteria bacterium]|nr:MBL fold metallo-hydrolase [Alphaproteobacteria bacterium]
MLVRFWGTRGSLPVSLNGKGVRNKVFEALKTANGRSFANDAALNDFIDEELPFSVRSGFGGNSSCVEIETGQDEYIICDMGSGLRAMGQHVIATHGPTNPQTYNIFMSHPHWDHIMGLPFFTPAYIPGNKIRIHGCHTTIEEALRKQQEDPCFPVHFDFFPADIEFVTLTPGEIYEIGGVAVRAIKQPHHGDSYGYRFEDGDKSVIYSTDGEHKMDNEEETERFVEFFRDADLLIFDAMYTLADMVSVKEDWGHSSNIIGVDLCHRAKVKQYCLFHHEPIYDDAMLQTILEETIRYEEILREHHAVKVVTAYDGLEIEV